MIDPRDVPTIDTRVFFIRRSQVRVLPGVPKKGKKGDIPPFSLAMLRSRNEECPPFC